MAASFRNTVLICVAIAALATLSRAFLTPSQAAAVIIMLMGAFVVAAAISFGRGLQWSREGGEVKRLRVPRAYGVALGCLAATAVMIIAAFIVSAVRR